MPIHLRAEHGAYADVCLLPGDPLRAKYIAETFFEGPVEVNTFRGLLGYTGTFEGKRVSVQASGMGCPSAAIVIEELAQLGVKRILRVGTCGGLQADVMGELIVPLSAAAADSTAMQYVDNEPYAPTASFEIVHELVHQAKELGKPIRVGPIVSSAIFYQPDQAQARRWAQRGLLAVEMEAAVLFTLGALRKIQTGCVLLVSDLVPGAHEVGGGQFVYISDEEMQKAVDEMSQLALRAVTVEHDGH